MPGSDVDEPTGRPGGGTPGPGDAPSRLARRLHLPGAVTVGLGAMLGTGVFVVWTPAWARAGSWLLAALVGAAVVAGLNAWSTARLAAVHPESGGAYAYGRHRLGRAWGLVAGVGFVVGKVSSAGAAALAVGTYLWPAQTRPVALAAVAVALALDLAGVVRTVRATAVSVAVVAAVLAAVVGAASVVGPPDPVGAAGSPAATPGGVLVAVGLLFVAFAGYARVATLGEEVVAPARTLPRAIGAALGLVLVVYLVVGALMAWWLPALAAAGRSAGPAPVADVAAATGVPALPAAVAVAAALAAGGTLLSLVAGVGRTLFAMAAAGDAPRGLAHVHARRRVPARAEVAAAAGVVVVVLLGGIGAALAVSAAGVLTYYGVAHLAALRLRPDEGRPPRAVPIVGLVGCGVVVTALAAAALGWA